MLYFSAMVLFPKAFFFAPLLLPFAVGNGIVAAGAYIAADVAAGGPQALAALKFGPVPVAGLGIGITTALVAPFVCVALSVHACRGANAMLALPHQNRAREGSPPKNE